MDKEARRDQAARIVEREGWRQHSWAPDRERDSLKEGLWEAATLPPALHDGAKDCQSFLLPKFPTLL